MRQPIPDPNGLDCDQHLVLPAGRSVSDVDHRAGTMASYHQAVRQVIPVMRERFSEPLSLQDLADVAALSPYHFNRVFRRITGIPPCQFLNALRLQEAKRLLLTTDLSVTDVCFEIGYNSLGTFTTRFTQLVGMSPTQLRDLARTAPPDLGALLAHGGDLAHPMPADVELTGRVMTFKPLTGLIFVGLFPGVIPQGRPVGCTLLTEAGVYRIARVPDGRYHAFAAAFPGSEDPLRYLLPDRTTLRVGMSRSPLVVHGGRVSGQPDIVLRLVRATDPPILSAMPLLLVEYLIEAGMMTP
jgi:AraC-like DNA-binding protein